MGGEGSGGARKGAGRPKAKTETQANCLLRSGFTSGKVDRQEQKQAEDEAQRREVRRQENEAAQARREQALDERRVALEREDEEINKQLSELANRLRSKVPRQRDNDDDGDGGDDDNDDDDDDDDDDPDFDYDAYEDSDDEDSDADEDMNDATGGTAKKRRRFRARAKPPKDSDLGKYLSVFMDQVASRKGRAYEQLKQGKKWFPADFDASTTYTKQPSVHPIDFYTCRFTIYAHLPHVQNREICGSQYLNELECIRCRGKGHLQSNGLDYRAAHCLDEDAQIVHRRLLCTECGGTFAEIDPQVLSQMDTRIVDRFPFLTTARSHAVHESLIYHFLELAPKGIGVGTYVNSVNSLKSLRHSKEAASYYDHAVNWVRGRDEELSWHRPHVFAGFHSPGKYNGFKLAKSLFRHILMRVLGGLESHLQTSFQLHADIGAGGDHCFKYAKQILDVVRGGKVFNTTYTIVSLAGMINANRLTFTKSNEELEPLLLKNKESRENAGVPGLKRIELDGGGERTVWIRVHPELLNGVRRWVSPNSDNGMIRASIEPEDFHVITTVGAANHVARVILDQVASTELVVVYTGTDTENNYDDLRLPKTIQLCFPIDIYPKVLVFHLAAMDVNDAATFPTDLRRLMEHDKIYHCGVKIDYDFDQMQKMQVELKHMIELMELAKQHDPSHRHYNMQALVERYLARSVDKTLQRDQDWNQHPLPQELANYAALDAKLSFDLNNAIRSKTSVPDCDMREAPTSLKEDDSAHFLFSNERAALVKVVHVGGYGSARKWGTTKVGKGKALVRLEQVLMPSVRAPFKFKAAETDVASGRSSWDEKPTLHEIVERSSPDNPPEIMVPTARLWKPLVPSPQTEVPAANLEQSGGSTEAVCDPTRDNSGESDGSYPSTMGTVASPEPGGGRDQATNITDAVDDNEHEQTVSNDLLTFDEDDIEEADPNRIRSRDKHDPFHILDAIPVARSCPVLTHITRLIIHATFLFDENDFDELKERLAEKKGLATPDDLLLDFYFNREWWRQRVRTYMPAPDEHGDRIRDVHDFVRNDPVLKKYYTEELKDYFVNFESKCRQGFFQELFDVPIFLFAGTDGDGLKKWYRLRGSTRCENVHQKQSLAIGPWGIGAMYAHFLLLWTDYCYNVNTGIARLNHHDFGHKHLYFIDRIKIRVMELYGVEIFPRHKNVSEFKGLDDYNPVGIGPLWLEDTPFVEVGEPDKALKGNLLFVAQRMKVRCPPVHVSGKDEIKIFRDFVHDLPREPKRSDIVELAKLYKEKTNCVTIFPKLPSMLVSYYKKWRKNREIERIQKQIGPGYDALLHRLATPVDGTTAPDGIKTQAQIPASMDEDISSPLDDDSPDQSGARVDPLPVPPLAAPFQRSFVTATRKEEKFRRCARVGCNMNAYDCGGFCADKCSNPENRQLTEEEHRSAASQREENVRKRKREQMAAKRAAKKAEREKN